MKTSESRNSSLSKLQRHKRPIEAPNSIEPMTELYLRQFFKNHASKVDQKQKQTLFSNSIEVLNLLIEEFEQKFGIQVPSEEPAFTLREGKQFEGFYNRIKNIFEALHEKIQQLSSHCNNEEGRASCLKERQGKQNYGECLFPQNSRMENQKSLPKYNQPQTDEQLYQLVIELKKQNQKDSEKIRSMEKDLKEKQKSLKSLEQKLNSSMDQLKKKQKENQDLTESLEKILEDKNHYEIKCNSLSSQAKDLKHLVQKSQVMLLLKDEQIKRLEIMEKGYSQASKEKLQLRDQLQTMSQTLKKLSEQRKAREKQYEEKQQESKRFNEENEKLRKIIARKLSLIDSSQGQENSNGNKFHGSSMKGSEEKIKQALALLIKNEKLVNETVEKELAKFIHNLIQKQNIMSRSITAQVSTSQKNS